MYLESIREGLEREISTPMVCDYFNNLKKIYQDLRRFEKPQELVDFLLEDDPQNVHAKFVVTKILLEGYQSRGDSLWGALLLQSFFPYILRCYRFLSSLDVISAEEAEMLVIESFYESASMVQLNEDNTKTLILNLLLGTNRTLSRQLKKDLLYLQTETIEPADMMDNIESNTPTPEEILLAREIILQGYQDTYEDTKSYRDDGRFSSELIFNTVIKDEPLSDYLKRQLDGVERKAFWRKYGQIKKKRALFLKKCNPIFP
ncbi:MAG: hypothetical protein GY854_19265 [Deltaproteobacteria bacterium]|nr:hypothetical protein [Deltaproteobacteria bacterium]